MVTELLRGGEVRIGDGTRVKPSREEVVPPKEVFENREVVHVKTV